MVTNEESTVDADTFTVRRTIVIEAPVDKVWAAVTEPQHLAGWFGQGATLDSLEVGAAGSLSFDGYGTYPLRVEEVEPYEVVAYRWSTHEADASAPDFSQSTVFRFTLEPADEGTRLTVVESGFGDLDDPIVALEGNREGWNSELDELVAYVESLA